jgi:hypothetical protein
LEMGNECLRFDNVNQVLPSFGYQVAAVAQLAQKDT